MIGIDTNILVRHLVNDDPKQGEKVGSLLKKNRSPGSIFISNIVLVELEWVLASVYGFSNEEIGNVFEGLLKSNQLAFENREVFLAAFEKYKQGNKDFSDSLIGELGKTKKIKTYTFDKSLSSDPNFIVI